MAIDAIGEIVCLIAQHLDTIFQRALAKELRKVKACIEAADLAVTVGAVRLSHACRVARIGDVTLNHHGSFTRNDKEIGTDTV